MARWDSLYIYYISGTGNARLSSEWIADEFRKTGLKTSVLQIDRLENISMPAGAERPLIGFAFPTHGFNAAPIMLRFIAGFPRGYGKEVFLLNTRAGMILLISLANGWLLMTIAGKLGIAGDALWWKILTQFISIGVMVAVAAVIYLAVHYAMAFKPIRWLARFTSLTTIPGWRRYMYLKDKRLTNEVRKFREAEQKTKERRQWK